jgi:hypothetical protein
VGRERRYIYLTPQETLEVVDLDEDEDDPQMGIGVHFPIAEVSEMWPSGYSCQNGTEFGDCAEEQDSNRGTVTFLPNTGRNLRERCLAERDTGRGMTTKKRKMKSPHLADVMYTDRRKRPCVKFDVRRKRITKHAPLLNRVPYFHGSQPVLEWVLYDRQENKIVPVLVGCAEPDLRPNFFLDEREGLKYLQTITLEEQQLLLVNDALDRGARSVG